MLQREAEWVRLASVNVERDRAKLARMAHQVSFRTPGSPYGSRPAERRVSCECGSNGVAADVVAIVPRGSFISHPCTERVLLLHFPAEKLFAELAVRNVVLRNYQQTLVPYPAVNDSGPPAADAGKCLLMVSRALTRLPMFVVRRRPLPHRHAPHARRVCHDA